MSPRAAAPGAVAIETAGSRMRLRQAVPRLWPARSAVLDAHRRDKLLEAVAIAAKELLRSSDLAVSLPKVIEQIGQATGVDRAHIFLVDAAGDDGRILQHHVWTVPGIATPPEFQNAKTPMADVGLKSWIPRLQRGETIVGHVRDFDAAARALFDLGGVKSTLWVPIFADGQWLGMIGFDDCHNERDWSAAEIDTIKTVAELVGAAVARTARLQTLADANRIIENSPTILYRLSPQQPFQLIYLSQNVRRYGYEADELLASPEPLVAAHRKRIPSRDRGRHQIHHRGKNGVHADRIPLEEVGWFPCLARRTRIPRCATRSTGWSPSRASSPISPSANAPKASCPSPTSC